MQLVIGNKNYSSWSLRPWLGLKMAGIAFEEILIPLYQEGSKAEMLKYSPTGRVPALLDGELAVWDSLAIAEYIAEKFPDRQLWPQDAAARAVARSVCAEMHSGFQALRTLCSMDIRARRQVGLTPEVAADIERIVAIWTDCRNRFAGGAPFLFGRFSWADAFYAPVVLRFVTYGITVPDDAQRYMETVLALPPVQEWIEAGRAEPWELHF
ncbi:glutathione S-transferase family protein [Chitiniphilus purpureus]|uniref:Glutathione S-transferase family protein n=1 Tax=Chitiniphilus purpureus TaxID=2981137 RepID=A0ABY6DL71_9NEIS|nr:glutathione S-transferase family protein [Chitiniphilus sp. CD1]UXY15110.1 glutathione S-transferase family protein [Chitiniphilus sp. CD1]